MGQTPFTTDVLRSRLPKNFDKPTDFKYDGTTDPQDHLDAFDAIKNLDGVRDATRCKAFSVTLKGAAMTWFNYSLTALFGKIFSRTSPQEETKLNTLSRNSESNKGRENRFKSIWIDSTRQLQKSTLGIRESSIMPLLLG
ncbi:hypothetical protein PIB30_006909 [Stylosanthes scabra]|uniref:Retrotransposon gag domain-containing protein n=1 Tax=Stylosanthes scabra TaxID=79078 RepID=A0ABU6X2L0_9FABA|nr:hypothetical protein [Stylosanthes scabra]